ncbi:MAG: hypothetical protein JMJ93_07560 [Synergistaceae bacterium]|nr:hypothetical protein [Synergistaceae bacterium]
MTGGIGGLSHRPDLPAGLQGTEREPQAPQTQRPGGLSLADGEVVEGRVLAKNPDGSLQVRLLGRELQARATMDLFPGQAFRAQWQNGTVPLLKLITAGREGLLSSLTGRNLVLAEALLSRGLPLGKGALDQLRMAWSRLGGAKEQLPALVELWARGQAMTEQNVAVIVSYLALDDDAVSRLWKRFRQRLSDRLAAGQPLKAALAEIRTADPKLNDLLSAMSLLGSPVTVDTDGEPHPLLRWPTEEGVPARVAVEKSGGLWHFFFDLPLQRLGPVEGEFHYDGEALALFLRAEEEGLTELRQVLRDLADDLDALPFALHHLGLSRRGQAKPRLYRGVDFEA